MNENPKRFPKQSTRNFYQEGKQTENYSLGDFLHGYLYAGKPYLYIGVGTGEHRLSGFLKNLFQAISRIMLSDDSTENSTDGQAFADSYHGKVIPVREAENLVSVKQEISVKDLEKVIPYTKAKDIILKNPSRIAVLDCPCRVSRSEPCHPLDVCIIVGEPFVSFILEHQPQRSRLISSEEAVEIIQSEHERGHVQHAFFKDAMLNRFYAICNCCACCCGAFQAHRNGVPMLASSGYICLVETELCRGCGKCEDSCQFFAVQVVDGAAEVDERACFGCGVCVDLCTEGAMELARVPERGDPLEILSLLDR